MKEYKSKIKLALIGTMIILFTLLISNFIVSFIAETPKTFASKLATNNGVGPRELVDQISIEGTCGEFEVTEFNSRNIGMSTGRILYCVEHGAGTRSGGETLHMTTALRYGDRDGNKRVWSKTHRYHREFEHNGEETYPYFECVGKHTDLMKDGKEDVAYIITYPPTNEWTVEKQYAVWRTGINTGNDLSSKDETKDPEAYAKSETIYNEAQKYKTFHEKTHENGGESDLKIKNATNENDVRTSVNQTQQKYVMGPISIDYNYGVEDGVAFGGISDMYAIGYNSKGEVVPGKDRIEIEKYYTSDGTGYKLDKETYFQPNMEEKSYVDNGEQVYPKGITGGEDEFYFEFSNPNTNIDYSSKNYEDNVVSYVKIHIDFQWMECSTCVVCELDCAKYKVNWNHKDDYNHCHGHTGTRADGTTYRYKCSGCCYYCTATSWLTKKSIQNHISVLEGSRKLYKSSLEFGEPNTFELKMDLGGYVWEDSFIGKESKIDGLNNTAGDKAIKNIRVMLYDENNKYITEKTTDDEGCYLFTNIDPMKKYYVAFEYNGQLYIPTKYTRDTNTYNAEEWKHTSKATEASKDREAFDNMFAEIGEYPYNYKRANGKYNKAYSHYELMGFKLDEKGNYYYDPNEHYADGFYEIKDGNIVVTDKINQAKVTSATRGADTQKLNFIDDCKIIAYTQAQKDGLDPDLYPVYDNFVINKAKDQTYTTGKQAREMQFDTKDVAIGGVLYKAIYPGQFFIDLGLTRRNEVDLALRKDILYATTKINGKAEVYKYDKRDNSNDNYWSIQYRMRNYANYYGGKYVNGIYQSDYDYRGPETNGGSNLEAYITYKITVRNSSVDILGQVTEVVDYYDNEYTYVPDFSWVMYKTNSSDASNAEIAVNEKQYHDMILNNKKSKDAISNAKPINSQTKTSILYDKRENDGVAEVKNDKSDIATSKKMQAVYVDGLANKKLAVGEQAYIYLTFKVNKNGTNPITLDTEDSLKMNYAEINGYKTYYTDGTVLPNDIKKTSKDSAGIIDMNSTPGNLRLADITGNMYEKNFENDTDRAKGLKIEIDDNAERKINGTVWEDERTAKVNGAIIGDGVRQDKEIKIKGVTVQLVEKLDNGKEFLWQTTTTDANGKYNFSKFIPGNYVVRFMYGHNKNTALTTNNGGDNNVSYNGQDFKSTVYQKDMSGKEISKYTDTYYDIKAADSFGKNVSDAKDIWTTRTKVSIGQVENNSAKYSNVTLQGRNSVINYSNKNVENYRAEVLASPYNDTKKIDELIKNTQMTAETGVIVIEGEYNRQSTIGDTAVNPDQKVSNGEDNYRNGNDKNGAHTINNLDFGLTERPKAQLELNKQVTNVKITLANGTVLFDADDAVANLAWIRHKDYNVKTENNGKYNEYYSNSKNDKKYNRYSYKSDIQKNIINNRYSGGRNGLIQITMDSELMHGATIQISYKLTVKNVGETDYTGQNFYYKATGASEGTKVTTTADLLVDYVANNLQYRAADNNGWIATRTQDLIASNNVDKSLKESLEKYNTIITTKKLNTALKPGEEVSGNLILTQTITAQNTQDNMNYQNIAEILQTSNSVGRRMAFSIGGNQNPTEAPTEIDSAKAEDVLILPPFGNTYLYFGLGIAVIVLIAGAVIFIKKKVLTK